MSKKKEKVNEDLLVKHNGKPTMVLNENLLNSQNAWANLEAIKSVHQTRLKLEDLMKKTRNKTTLQLYDDLYTLLEFRLQELWGFARNANYHRFWERPKCKCPTMDNEDMYPYRGVMSGGCPLHWRIK